MQPSTEANRTGLSSGAPQRRGRPSGAEPVFLSSREPAMKIIEQQAARVATSDETILLLGETGVGKDVLAHRIHDASPRARKPFVAINCAALPEGLLESELFGHVRGAYTGAVDSRSGRIEAAAGGTVFLDEIAELPPRLQAKLLHLLQGGAFCRVGGREPVHADVRFIAATNQDLDRTMETGQFRRDLYYRLCVVHFTIPPLRERPADIEDLSHFFAAKYSSRFNRPDMSGLSETAMEALRSLRLDGNVRELENLIKRAILLGGYHHMFQEPKEAVVGDLATSPLKEISRRAVVEAERRAIKSALSVTRWNRRGAARLLKVSYRSLLQKIADYSILPGADDGVLRHAQSAAGRGRSTS